MKKLITILLSMTMCFCLCSTNNNIKADDTPVTIGYKIFITGQKIYKNDTNGDEITNDINELARLGITINPDVSVITFSKSLVNTYTPLIINDGTRTIKINNNIMLKSTSGSSMDVSIGSGTTTANVTLTSDNNSTLTLDSCGYCFYIYDNCKLTIDNVDIKMNDTLDNNGKDICVAGSGQLEFKNNAKAEMSVSNTGAAYAIYCSNNSIIIPPNYMIKGRENATSGDLKDSTRTSSGSDKGHYQIDGIGGKVNAKYIEIKPMTLEDGEMEYDGTNEYFYSSYIQGSASALTAHIGCEQYVNTPNAYVVKEGTVTLTEGTDYDLSDGSLKVTFKPSYLNTLSVGEHNLKISVVSNSNEYDVKFTVGDATPPVDNSTPTTCEYVIGPRWHWNDAKGVCELEGYSVINRVCKK